jgi:hypothetical protein
VNRLRTVTAILFLFGAFVPQQAHAAFSALEQVDEVTRWFTGNFNNAEQVSREPSIPFITLSTCQVQLESSTAPSGTQSLYLAQPEINRFRLYSFEPANNDVTLSIRSFLNPVSLSGICGQPLTNRVLNQSNLASAVCNLTLFRETDSYTGSNDPIGCPIRGGGRVVSTATIEPDTTISLDKIYNSTGQLLVGTPIEFRRTVPVPEPTMATGLVMVGVGLVWLRRKR